MEINAVNQEDGRAAAAVLDLLELVSKLIDALKLAGLPIQGPSIQNKDLARSWMSQVAKKMADDVRKQQAEKPMSVKSLGVSQKLSSSKPKSKKKK